jgi:peptide/nickel transport system permease protein
MSKRTRETKVGEDERLYYATQWQLVWWQFRKHKMALVGLVLLVVMYLVAILPGLFAPNDANLRFSGYESSPPTPIHLRDEEGNWQRPFIYGRKRQIDPKTLAITFVEDTTASYPIKFFVPSEPHKLLGLEILNWRIFGTGEDGPPVLLFGTDRLARDIFSRTIYGSSISLFIGLGGVVVTFFIGITLGGISGFVGGVTDEIIQRTIDFLLSTPNIPLWMVLAAAIPREWPVTQVYLAITLILSVIGWGGLARVVRGKLLSLREEDFVMAARLYGTNDARLIARHLLPNFASYLLVNITLAIPSTILGETSLSFLGLGMQPPAVSWGVLLKDAQELVVAAQRPWQLIPGLFVVLVVLMFNFVGDGLRDAADPYTRG